jgi:hypothetical protein
MSKKINVVVVLVGMCALSLFLLNCGSSSSRPAGLVYVLTQGNNGIGNNVSSFAMNLNNGELSLINSNAPTCVPTGGSCGAQLDILLDPKALTAFVLNQGAPPCPGCSPGDNNPTLPTIYPYTVNSDGSLSAPQTPVTWTCTGTNVMGCSDTAVAMERDALGQFLFVIDYGSYPTPGYPTPNMPYASCPHAPTAAYDVCPSLSVFAMTPGSTTLALANGSPMYLSKIPSALSSITFIAPGGSPQELLFVSNNLDICSQNCISPSPHNDNTVSVYSVGSDGTLSEQANSPYAIAAPNPISVFAVNTNQPTTNTGGVFVYVGNQASGPGALNPFVICTVPGNTNCTQQQVAVNQMIPLATCPQPSCLVAPTAAGQSPVQMVVDPTNNFLYVASEGSNQAYGFRINTTAGTLSPLPSSPQPTGSQPLSMALHPSVNNTGQFLYLSNGDSDNITGFTLSTTTGIMSDPVTIISPAVPTGLAVH